MSQCSNKPSRESCGPPASIGSNESCDIPRSELERPSGKGGRLCFSSCLKSSDSKYTITLENEYDALQTAFFALTTHFARVQFRLRQIIQSHPQERDRLLLELASITFCGIEDDEKEDLPRMKKDLACLGNIRRRQGTLIESLRNQMDFFSLDNIPSTTSSQENSGKDDGKANNVLFRNIDEKEKSYVAEVKTEKDTTNNAKKHLKKGETEEERRRREKAEAIEDANLEVPLPQIHPGT